MKMAGTVSVTVKSMGRQFLPMFQSVSVRCGNVRNLRSNMNGLNNRLQCYRFMSQAENAPKRQVPRLKPAMPKKKSGGYPLLIIPLTCVGLGVWQISRKQWKENLINDLEIKLKAKPIPLPYNLEELNNEDIEYTRVTVRGRFDHSRELFVGPRQNINDKSTHPNPQETMGVYVVTPFKLSDRDETILVNRGHVTFKNQPHQLRQEGQIEEEVELTGIVRRTEQVSMMGDNKEVTGFFGRRDVEEMAYIAETAPVFIDADLNSSVSGGPVGGQTRVQIRNEHLQYMITWFILAAFTSWFWHRSFMSVRPSKSIQEYIKRNHHKL